MLEGKAANNNKNCPHIAPFATACGKRRQAEEHTLSKQRKHICTAERTHSGLYGNNKQNNSSHMPLYVDAPVAVIWQS
jgi:hypothetical protein